MAAVWLPLKANPPAAAQNEPRRATTPGSPAPIETVRPSTDANRELLAAVRANDSDAVRAAFEHGADPNAVLETRFAGAGLNPPKPVPPTPLLRLQPPDAFDRAKRQAQAVTIFHEFLRRGMNVKASEADATQGNPVLWAIGLNDVTLVREVLDQGGNPNGTFPAPLGGNAVHAAVMQTLVGREAPFVPMTRLILERGGNPNVYDGHGMTPLHQAALGMPETVKLLLEHGADPTLPTRSQGRGFGQSMPDGLTPLTLARRGGNETVIRLLTAAKTKTGLSLEEAASIGDVATLRKYLESGGDPNATNTQQQSLLFLAAGSGQQEAVRLLLQHKASANAVVRGSTALLRAAQLGDVRTVGVLLDGKANINYASYRRPDFPETALTRAVYTAQPAVVALLLRRGVDLTRPGNRDALYRSIQSAGSIPVRVAGQDPAKRRTAEQTLNAQGDVYELLVVHTDVRKNGGEAFCAAIYQAQWGMAEDLLRRGANPNACDRGGQAALFLTVNRIAQERYEATHPFGNKPADANEARQRSQRYTADDRDALAFLRLLLSHKPNVSAVTAPNSLNEGGTALALALREKMGDVVALLRKAGATR